MKTNKNPIKIVSISLCEFLYVSTDVVEKLYITRINIKRTDVITNVFIIFVSDLITFFLRYGNKTINIKNGTMCEIKSFIIISDLFVSIAFGPFR